MSLTVTKLIEQSEEFAASLDHRIVTVDHLAYVTLNVKSVQEFLKSRQLSVETIQRRMLNGLKSIDVPNIIVPNFHSIAIDSIKNDIRKESIIQQLKSNDISIEPYFVLLECLTFTETVLISVLESLECTAPDLIAALGVFLTDLDYTLDTADTRNEMGNNDNAPEGSTGRSGKSALQEYCSDLTQEALDGKLDPLIGRVAELNDMVQVLSRKTKKNVALVGAPGTGKTQIVNGFAHIIATGNVPDNLKNCKVYSLSMASLMAGTKFRGDLEGRVERLIKEMKANPNYILFIDEIHTMMGTGGSGGGIDINNMIKPALSKGEMRVIGATTYEEYNNQFEEDPALARRFMKLDVVEPTLEETRTIINGLKKTYEKFHEVKFPKATIESILELANKYIKTKKFPDKAIDLMDAAGARNRVKDVPNTQIERADIEFEVSRIANLSLEIVACNESDRMRDLEKNLNSTVFGQDDAIKTLVKNVLVARAGLRDQSSIQGAFLFVGPSGTGKTEISKALSNSLGLELIRFDMAEFAQEHTVGKLIGAPPGYVGYDAGNGALLDRVDQAPNSILLLDEIEKAHPKVLQTLLSMMDEGHLTGSHGKTVYFNNVTVIMTSNLGARNVDVRSVAFGPKGGLDGIDTAVKDRLAPEFINRLDAIVKFNDLDNTAIESIVDKFIGIINTDNKDRKVQIQLDKSAKAWLVKNGVEKGMGARPMKRVINEHIKVQLAQEMLFGFLVSGGKAKFTVQDDKLVLVSPKPKQLEPEPELYTEEE